MTSRLIYVTGRIEPEGQVIHIIADDIQNVSATLESFRGEAEEIDIDNRADEVPQQKQGARQAHHPRGQAKVLFSSRDFH